MNSNRLKQKMISGHRTEITFSMKFQILGLDQFILTHANLIIDHYFF